MSDIENKKVQDILREVVRDENQITCINSGTLIRHICQALGISPDGITYGDDLRKCLIEIADRIDRQSVVEVQVPHKPKPEPDSDQPDPAAPNIYLNDCIIHVYGSDDDQD